MFGHVIKEVRPVINKDEKITVGEDDKARG